MNSTGNEEVAIEMRGSSRRSFLAGFTTAMAGLPAAAAPAGEAYWLMVRRQFPFREEKIPMNAANMCPPPRAVTERLVELTRDTDADCSFDNRAKFKILLERSRAHIARQLRVNPDELALVRNTTEANNIICNGLPLEPGDEVLLWDQNHPTNNVAWDVRAARFGFQVRRVSTPPRPAGPEELAEVFIRALSPRTRVLSITHLSNVTGVRLPVRRIAEAARKRGVFVHVDGAQTWGAFDLDLREMGCDSFSASAQKWFVGPREAGILYVRAEHIPRIWPGTVGADWGRKLAPKPTGARKFESMGQRDDARLAALDTAAEFLDSIGQQRIEARVLELAKALKDRLAGLGVNLITPPEPELSGGVCIIEAPEENRRKAVEILYRDWGIAAAPTGGLRLCPHIYNTMEHIDRAVRAVKAVRDLLA